MESKEDDKHNAEYWAITSLARKHTSCTQPQELKLPNELWLEIFSQMSTECMLRMREVCKRFFGLTKDRLLWVRRMAHLSVEHQLTPAHASATAEELENQVVHHVRYRLNLIRGNATLSAFRLQEGVGDFTGYFLVPGGQWLLTAVDNTILCWDLNESGSGPSVICSSDVKEGYRVEQMQCALDVSGTGATLAVTRRSSSLPKVCDFFTVELTLQKPGVTYRGSFTSPDGMPHIAFFVSGFYALGVYSTDVGQQKVFLFDWEAFLAETAFWYGRAGGLRPTDVQSLVLIDRLLHDRRIIAYSIQTITVFAPPPLQKATTMDFSDAHSAPLDVLWRISPTTSIASPGQISSGDLNDTLYFIGNYGFPLIPGRTFRLVVRGRNFNLCETEIPATDGYGRAGYVSMVAIDAVTKPGKWKIKVFTRAPVGFVNRLPGTEPLSVSNFEIDAHLKIEPWASQNSGYDELSGRIVGMSPGSCPRTGARILRIGIVDLQ